MKVLTILSIVAVARAAATPAVGHERRQVGNLGTGLMQSLIASQKKPSMSPANLKKAAPQVFPQAIREQFIFGPFKTEPSNSTRVPAGLKLDNQSDMIEQVLTGLCKDCMVLRATAEITNKDGKRLALDSGLYTHHILVVNTGRGMGGPPLIPRGNSCAGKQPSGNAGELHGGMASPKSGNSGSHGHARRAPQASGTKLGGISIFIVKGNEGDASTFSPINNSEVKSGYWIGRNDPIIAVTEVINYKDVAQDVYFSIDMEYMPFEGARPANWLDVGFGTIMVETCGDINLRPAKDKVVTYNSTEFTASANGYIVGLTPHLHDGGLYIKLLVNDKVVCQADAIYGQDGGTKVNGEQWETITSYSPCRDPIAIKAGDRVKTSSDYDLRKHKLRPDSKDHDMEAEGMSIALFHFARNA